MSRIAAVFQRARAANRAVLAPFLTLGYPYRDAALDLVPALLAAGADLVELGVPFSDPLADGATIQAASQQALTHGMTPALALTHFARLRAQGVAAPLLWMGYYNPILQMGLVEFAARAADAGVDGVIVPDLPPEEADPLQHALQARGLDLIFLLAPTSGPDRVRDVAWRSTGFVYLVSVTGVTGARDHLPPDLPTLVQRVRAHTQVPVVVGFGIATPEQAAQVARWADGVVVGSALLQAMAAATSNPLAAARDFVAALAQAVHGARQ